MEIVSKRTGQARGPALRRGSAGTFVGTPELLAEVVQQSLLPPSWRPARAAAAMAAAKIPPGHRWMTPEEAKAWIDQHFPFRKQTMGRNMMAAVGIGNERKKAIYAGAPVAKMEAMAMAHYALFGWDRPRVDTTEEFVAWFTPRFGTTRGIAEGIGIKRETVAQRLAGFVVKSTGRYERLPDAGMIRAMDWALRVGPFSPYGDRIGGAFPGQEV